jgi:hypothetical protein
MLDVSEGQGEAGLARPQNAPLKAQLKLAARYQFLLLLALRATQAGHHAARATPINGSRVLKRELKAEREQIP